MSQHTLQVLETAVKVSNQVNVRGSCLLLVVILVERTDQLVADADHQFIPLNLADQDPILF